MAKLFEIIIFTSGIETFASHPRFARVRNHSLKGEYSHHFRYASPIIDRLDPQKVVAHRLYRPATSLIKGTAFVRTNAAQHLAASYSVVGLHVKNLSRLARPLQANATLKQFTFFLVV
jgi:TFIIF-interacting CTD phosphatase-like protein